MRQHSDTPTIRFEYSLGHHRSGRLDRVDQNSLHDFAVQHGVDIQRHMLDIAVTVFEDGVSKYKTDVRRTLFHTNERERVLLADGRWHAFNEDYLQYLRDSIAEIPVTYASNLDYSEEQYGRFIDDMVARIPSCYWYSCW